MRPEFPKGRLSARTKLAAALLGVQGVAVSAGCFGGLLLFWGVVIVGFSGRLYNPSFEFAEFAFIAVYPVAVVTSVLSAGLLRSRPWARRAAIVWSIVVGLLTPLPLRTFLGEGYFDRALDGYASSLILMVALALPATIVMLLLENHQRLPLPAPVNAKPATSPPRGIGRCCW